MNVRRLHSWKLTPKQAVQVQRKLRRKVSLRGEVKPVRLVAGADVSYKRNEEYGYAAVVVLTFPDLKVVETAVSRARLEFPYVPGLLTFREGPVLAKAFRKITSDPDVVLFDGHGIAHPRQFGLACHMGILLDRPSVGCAKSVLVGRYRQPARRKGSYSALRDGYFTLGRALRTRAGIKPIFVSPGHNISLPRSTELVLQCALTYRLPEPTRLAHQAVTQARLRA